MPKNKRIKLINYCKRKRVTCKVVKNFKHCRVAPKEFFDKRSFRVKNVDPKRNIKITIGCPIGKFNDKRKRCNVGTRTQKIMYPKNLSPSDSTLRKLKHQGRQAWC